MKNVVVSFVLSFAAFSAQANYLYWQLSDTVTMQNTGSTYTLGEFTGGTVYQYARVYAVQEGSEASAKELGTISADGQYSPLADGGVTQVGSAGQYLVNLGDAVGSAYSYYVEYVGYNVDTSSQTQIGTGERKSYENLATSIVKYNSEGFIPVETASVWHGGTANAPEPTSAMLMLLGVAGLALRRKQRKLA